MFKEFTLKENDDSFLDIKNDNNKVLDLVGIESTERYLAEYIQRNKLVLSKLKDQNYLLERNKIINDLRERSNLSIRDIARLLKISRGMVSRAIKE